MRIGIDIRCLQTPSKTRGIGVFTYNLIYNLLLLDKKNDYFLFAFKNTDLDFNFPKGKLCYLPHPGIFFKFGWLKDNFFVNKILEKHDLDIFYFTSPFEIFMGLNLKQKTRFKKMTTVYDLTPLYFMEQSFPRKLSRKYLKFFHSYALNSIRYADKIITISQNTAKDLKKELKIINDEKMSVIYCGIDEKFFLKSDEKQLEFIRKKYNLPSDFLLYVGSVTPTKNIKFLLNTIKKLRLPLVIAGHRTEKDKKFLSENLDGIENLVYFPEFIPQEDLPLLYKAAKIFVFPSLYEGFGMPPAEAMASGTPVISSNRSSLPEVMGSAGILIDPDDEQNWIKEITNLWNNSSLRKEFSQKGVIQAKKFSWTQSAEKILEIFNNENSN